MAVQGAYMSMISACFLGLVFLRAILHKAGSYVEYVGQVRDYRILPEVLVPTMAAILLVLECAAVAGLILPQTRGIAAGLASGLLLGYAAAIGVNLLRGRNTIDCGCGGGGQGISALHLLRNAVLAVFAVPVMANPAVASAGAGAFMAASGCVLVLWLTYLVFDQLLGNYTHATASAYSKL
jgi:hypothetical protein